MKSYYCCRSFSLLARHSFHTRRLAKGFSTTIQDSAGGEEHLVGDEPRDLLNQKKIIAIDNQKEQKGTKGQKKEIFLNHREEQGEAITCIKQPDTSPTNRLSAQSGLSKNGQDLNGVHSDSSPTHNPLSGLLPSLDKQIENFLKVSH